MKTISIIFLATAISLIAQDKSDKDHKPPEIEVTLEEVENTEIEHPPVEAWESKRIKSIKDTQLLTVSKKGLIIGDKKVNADALIKGKIYELKWDETLTFGEFYKSLPLNYRMAINKRKNKFYTKWVGNKKSEDEPDPTIDIYLLKNEHIYQGQKRTRKLMKTILNGISGAMGDSITIHLKVKEDITLKRLNEFMLISPDFIFFMGPPNGADQTTNPVLTTVKVEEVETNPQPEKDKKPIRARDK